MPDIKKEKKMQSNYYIVKAVCGHVGRGKAVDKEFAVYAHSGKEAAAKAREIPRVKHDYKFAIKSVSNVDLMSFNVQKLLNDMDPFLNCGSKWEQYLLCPSLPTYRLHEEEEKKTGRKISKRAYVNNYCFHDEFEGEY